MASGGAFGGARGLQPKPPEKGVFPLDHFGECKAVKEEYMKCLKENKHDSEKCKGVAKKYLECRMSKNLMAQEDLSKLGFKEYDKREDQKAESVRSDGKKPRGGFVAGIPKS